MLIKILTLLILLVKFIRSEEISCRKEYRHRENSYLCEQCDLCELNIKYLNTLCFANDVEYLTVIYKNTSLVSKLDWLLCNPKEFIMRNGSVKLIASNTFEDFQSTKKLDLSGNQIEMLFGRSFFVKSSIEMDINLSANWIKTIEDGAFVIGDGSGSFNIDLSHNQLGSFNISSLNGSRVSRLDLSFNKISEINIDPLHEVKLDKIVLHENSIKNLSSFRFPDSASWIDLSYNNIESIPINAFANLINLTYLSLSNNHLQDLHPRVFDSLNQLETLDLSNNHLVFKDLQAIHGLNSLKTFYFHNNQIDILTFPNFSLPEFKEVSYYGNKLNLTCSDINNLLQRKYHDPKDYHIDKIQDNRITCRTKEEDDARSIEKSDQSNIIYDTTCDYTFGVDSFLCSDEDFFGIYHLGYMCPIVKPAYINVLWSRNSVLNQTIVAGCTLSTFRMFNGSLKDILPRTFEFFGGLQVLTFRENRIKRLRSETFLVNIYEYLRIDLSRNQINIIEDDAFDNGGRPDPFTIFLSYNQLRSFNLTSLGQNTVDLLDLSFNKVSKINMDPLHQPKLYTIDLRENSIKDLSTFSFPDSVSSIDLSCNDIKSISADTFSNLVNLTYLNLSKNHLQDLHSAVFQFSEKLEILDLSNNKLMSKDLHPVNRLKSLTTFYFHNNQIEILAFQNFSQNLKEISFYGNKLNLTCSEVNNILLNRSRDYIMDNDINKIACKSKPEEDASINIQESF